MVLGFKACDDLDDMLRNVSCYILNCSKLNVSNLLSLENHEIKVVRYASPRNLDFLFKKHVLGLHMKKKPIILGALLYISYERIIFYDKLILEEIEPYDDEIIEFPSCVFSIWHNCWDHLKLQFEFCAIEREMVRSWELLKVSPVLNEHNDVLVDKLLISSICDGFSLHLLAHMFDTFN